MAQSRIQATEQQLLRLEQQIERLRQEREQLTSDPDLGDFALLQEEVSEAELQAEEQQARLEEIRTQLEDVREDSEQRRKELEQGRQRLQSMLGRKATLEALQKAALGQSSEGVTHWLESHQLARKPRLAQQITVADGWEVAVETVLGDYLQAVLVDDLAATGPWLGGFTDGTLTLWEQGSAVSSPAGSLLDKVDSSQDLSAMLAKVRVAEDLNAALTVRNGLAPDESVITPDGIWMGPNWLRVARDQDNEGGVLARQQELELIDAEADELDISVEEWEADLESVLLRQRSLEQQRDNAQHEWQTISRKLMEQKARLSGQQAKAEQLKLRTDKLEQSLTETEETRTLEAESLAELRLEWQEAMSAVDEDTDERERLQSNRTAMEQRLSQARMAAGQQKDRLHQLQLQLQALNSREESLRQAISRLAEAMSRLKERREQINANQNRDHTADLELLRAEMEALQEEKIQAEEVMTQARHALEQADASLRQLEQQRSEAEQQALAERNKLEQVRMECQALDIRRNSLVDQLREDNVSMAEVLDSLPDAANEEQWVAELSRIDERIQRLGAINLAAIDEYKLQSERKVYLDAQNDDLEKALDTLEGAIRKIDAETRNRFQETFDRMNAGLADLFPKVFGGGHASLELTSDDLLTTGVAIMARPPGKKNSTIHLLSGGEKALTAIALVFSIFQLNPAPFCMLDEVDAPLDDANVGRYARLVKAMSEKVQFIYITHNKIAMEMAEQLMGVTMHEPGVSRLVSVDVEEAAGMVDVAH